MRLRAVAISVMLAWSFLVLVAPRAAADWCSASFMTYSPSSGYAGRDVTFTFTFENGADATIQVYDFSVSYSWGGFSDFGPTVVAPYGSKSGTSTQQLPPSAGSESIWATVSGEASTDNYPISCSFGPMPFTIDSVPPLAVSVYASANLGDAPLSVSFTSVVTGGASPYAYAWAFGDGNRSDVPNPRHTYASPGTFDATVIVTDGAATTTSASVNIVVNPALQLSVLVTPSTGTGPLPVQFHVTVSGGTPPYVFHWSFGDGNTSSVEEADHIYERPGTYNATLTVSDSVGGTSSQTVPVVVQAPESPGGSGGLGGAIVGASWFIAVAIAAAAAAGLLLFVVYRRSRRKMPPTPPPNAPQ